MVRGRERYPMWDYANQLKFFHYKEEMDPIRKSATCM